MEKKKVFFEVDVQKEQPTRNGRYYVKCEDGSEDGNIFLYGKFFGEHEIGKTTHWLKEQELYCFNEIELAQFLKWFMINVQGEKQNIADIVSRQYIQSLNLK